MSIRGRVLRISHRRARRATAVVAAVCERGLERTGGEDDGRRSHQPHGRAIRAGARDPRLPRRRCRGLLGVRDRHVGTTGGRLAVVEPSDAHDLRRDDPYVGDHRRFPRPHCARRSPRRVSPPLRALAAPVGRAFSPRLGDTCRGRLPRRRSATFRDRLAGHWWPSLGIAGARAAMWRRSVGLQPSRSVRIGPIHMHWRPSPPSRSPGWR